VPTGLLLSVDPPKTRLAPWASRLAYFSLQAALVGLVLHRFTSFPTPATLNLFAVAYAGAGVALLCSIIAFIAIWRRGDGGARQAVAGFLVSFAMLAVPLASLPDYLNLPKINDVTTDPTTPPPFRELARARVAGMNSSVYPGAEFARLQSAAYPDLQPMQFERTVEDAYEIVRSSARRLRWEIVSEEPPGARGRSGFIEAVDRTMFLGFRDDVAIRVTGDRTRARLDVRSASRYGRHDLGRNANRVRALFKEVQARLDGLVPLYEDDPKARVRRKRPRARDLAKGPPGKTQTPAQSNARHGPVPKGKRPAQDARRAPDKRPARFE